jgi:Tol biopolymer transport system component
VCAARDAKEQSSLWLRQVSTNSLVRIVPPENGVYLATTFAPDGEMIYYVGLLERSKFVPTLYRIPVLGVLGSVNVWTQPIDGTAPKQLTNFKSNLISNFAISRDGTIAVYRVSVTRDIVLIKDFR